MFRIDPNRRTLMRQGFALAALAAFARAAPSRAAMFPDIAAYRNPGCGCCEKWATGLQAAGFKVTLTDDAEFGKRRSEAGVPPELAGCHTSFVGDYVIEGHVPAEDIIRFLEEKLQARGLAVAGMPMGSPGMEMGDANDAYDVMLFTADGKSRVYAHH